LSFRSVSGVPGEFARWGGVAEESAYVLRRERGASAPRIAANRRKGFSPGPSPNPNPSSSPNSFL
jgi:hypothetical protein